jgi:hypothetical protein
MLAAKPPDGEWRNSRRQPMRRLMALGFALVILAAPAAASAGGRPFVVSMTGAQEVPAADPDGSGTAWFTLNYGQGEICYTLFVQDILLPATGAHIHLAPIGVAGGVVVPLTAPDVTGWSSGCASADQGLIKAIQQSPGDYYVNVHNSEYPGGAVRGQLSK